MPEVELFFLDNGAIDKAIIRGFKPDDEALTSFIFKIKNLTNKYNNVLFN